MTTIHDRSTTMMTSDHDPDTGTGSTIVPAPGSPAHVRQLADLRASRRTQPTPLR